MSTFSWDRKSINNYKCISFWILTWISRKFFRIVPPLFFVSLIVILAACSTKLAPDYDPAMVEGLSKANENAMTLFADISSGTQAAKFQERKETYNGVIGHIDALRLQAKTRPQPDPQALSRLSENLEDGGNKLEILKPPTEDSLAESVKILTRLRDEDQARGLTPILVQGFKRSYEISMDQALTYEKALKR